MNSPIIRICPVIALFQTIVDCVHPPVKSLRIINDDLRSIRDNLTTAGSQTIDVERPYCQFNKLPGHHRVKFRPRKSYNCTYMNPATNLSVTPFLPPLLAELVSVNQIGKSEGKKIKNVVVSVRPSVRK